MYDNKKSYTYIFHMPGIEAWFWRMLDQISHLSINLVLDIGVGLGFWGFMIRSWAGMRELEEPSLVGIDVNKVRLATAKSLRIYDELIVADAYCPPLRPGSFDLIVAVEVFDSRRLTYAVQQLDKLASKESTIFLSIPFRAGYEDDLVSNGYRVYSIFLRGLLLVDTITGRVIPYHKSTFSKITSIVLAVAWRLFRRKSIRYVIAFKGPESKNLNSY